MTSISPSPRSGMIPDSTGPVRAEVQGPKGPGFAAMLDAADRARRFDGTVIRTSAERFNEDGFFADAGAVADQWPRPACSTDLVGKEEGSAVAAVADPPVPQASRAAPAAAVKPDPMGVGGPAPSTSSDISSHALAGGSGSLRRAVLDVGPPDAGAAALVDFQSGDMATSADKGNATPVAPRGARAVSPDRFREAKGGNNAVSVMLDAAEGIVTVTGAHKLTETEARTLRADIAALLRRHGLVLDDLRLDGRSMADGRNDPQEG